MFWKYNVSCSPMIEAIVAKEDVTLQEVMNSDDIINECRLHNKALIDYLQKPNVMEELVTLTTKEPSIEVDERIRFKYSNIACELLTCDVPALNERLASDELLLDKLFTFLDSETPLNPLLASFFSKIMGALIAKKTEQNWLSYQFTCLQVLDFLKTKDTFISLLLKHLGTSAIMDLMLKLFTQVEGIETKQNILNWLDSQQIIQSLVSMLNPNIDKDRHHNAAQLLCDFIRIARDNQGTFTERAEPDPLLNTLESTETISLLLDKMLNGEKCESSIVGGVQILLALLDVNQNSISKFNSATTYANLNDESSEKEEQKQKVANNITNALLERMADIHDLLLNPPKTTPVELTIGVLDPPLGQTRFQVLKLFAAVISSNNRELLNKIISLGTFPVMLDLFFKYPWNNFLHTQVERCLVFALRTYVSEDSDDTAIALCKHLLENCKLVDRILEAWKHNDEQQQAKGVRQGYMGHLINILNEIMNACAKTYLGQFVKENHPETHTALEEFKEKTLDEVNKTQRTLLGGAHPNSSNNNDSGDFNESSLPQSLAFQQQQMFAEYQMPYVNSRFIEGYSGFNDDAFNDGGDTLQTVDHRTDMNFDLSDNALAIQVFKQLCSQSINTLEDADDQIFDDKDHTFQTVIEKDEDDGPAYSAITDEDDDSPTEGVMDVDLWSSSKPESGDSSTAKISAGDPWSNEGDSTGVVKGVSWADFTSATFEADFSKAFESQFSTNIDNEKTLENVANFNEKPEIVQAKEEQVNVKVVEEMETEKTPCSIVQSDVLVVTDVEAQDDVTSTQISDQEEAAGDPGNKLEIKSEIASSEPSMNISEGDCMSRKVDEQQSTVKAEN